MSVEVGDSVFYACQEALQTFRRDQARQPKWLILGDDEWRRLVYEIREGFPNVGSADVEKLVEFQGAHVAHYAVPSHLEVLP